MVKKEPRERERDVCLVWCFEMTLRRRCVLRDERCTGNSKRSKRRTVREGNGFFVFGET